MKVLLINGSPRGDKCTKAALSLVADELLNNGIETEIYNVGTDSIRGCMGCGGCAGKRRCVYDDGVNECIEKMKDCDGLVVGSPVHYASLSGAITSFMDRLCYAGGSYLSHKVGASVVSCRRGGASAALDQLNKYFSILNMPIATSNYWNMVHGNTPEEVMRDEEGVQTMQVLGKNMAWLLKSINIAKENGVTAPSNIKKIKTNYIR